MHDNAPLNLEEIVNHCRALAFAIIDIVQPSVKEQLIYILLE